MNFCRQCCCSPCRCTVVIPGPIGPTGPTGATGPAAPAGGDGAILAYGGELGGFSMEPFIVTLTTFANGIPNDAVFYGFTGFPIPVSSLADTMDLGTEVVLEPLLLPRQGTITSFSAKFIMQQVNLPINAGVHARIYQNNTPSNNIFTLIPGTDIELAPRIIGTIPAPPLIRVESVGIRSGLNIPVVAGTRLLMNYYVSSTLAGEASEVTGNGGGAIAIA